MNTRRAKAKAEAERQATINANYAAVDNVITYMQGVTSLNLYMLDEIANGTYTPVFLPNINQQFILWYCGFPTNFGTETNPQINQLSDIQLLTNHRIVTLSNNTDLLNIMLANPRLAPSTKDVASQIVSAEPFDTAAAAATETTPLAIPLESADSRLILSTSNYALFSDPIERVPSPIFPKPDITDADLDEWLQSMGQPTPQL